jgi:hypothetical protein
MRNRILERKRIKHSNLPNEQNIESSMKFKEFYLIDARALHLKIQYSND